MHRLLQLPVEHKRGTPTYYPLSDAAIENIREKLQNVALIIIDEISMVSNVNFLCTYLRLQEIFNSFDNTEPFGKRHMLLFGDLLQLPPVSDSPVFLPVSKAVLNKCVHAMAPVDLWSMLDYDELRINMRQKNDVTYKKILRNLRLGTITEEDTEKLRTRYINLISNNPINCISKLCDYIQSLRAKELVVIVPINEMCDALNQAMLARNNNKEIELIAQDHVDSGDRISKKTSS